MDGHSFTSRPLPFEKDQSSERPDICIGTDDFHTPEALAAHIRDYAARRGMSARRNFPFAGAITPMMHYRRDARVQSVMLEVNRKLYMNEETGDKLARFDGMRGFVRGLLESMADFSMPGRGSP